MPYTGLLSLPYIPNRKGQNPRQNNRSPYPFIHRIAYTETMRGLYDEVPTLLFYGAPFRLLQDVCVYLFKMMQGKVKNLIVDRERSCRWKNGKCYWRTMIRIVELDEQFISLREFTRMILYRMQTVCNCTVRHYKLEVFVNL